VEQNPSGGGGGCSSSPLKWSGNETLDNWKKLYLLGQPFKPTYKGSPVSLGQK